MDIPEEEIEQAIIWDLGILKLRSSGKLELIERQRTLSTADGFIDLFLKDNKRYYVVELKRDYIKNQKVVTEQTLRYRNSLCEELGLSPEEIVCVVASPQGVSPQVKEICKINHVIPKKLSEDRILSVLADKTKDHDDTEEKQETVAKIILDRRKKYFGLDRESPDFVNNDVNSTWDWVNDHKPDEQAKRRIAALFKEISANAPIQAHQVHEDVRKSESYRLESFEEKWFWLFYTILDKRSNASTFIKARKFLEKENLFLPQQMIEYIEKYGKETAVEQITTILEKNKFPLLHDFKLGRLAVATSIVTAAEMISKYHYDFDEFYNHYMNSSEDVESSYSAIRNELGEIYGVGPRMVSQFIRGMVIKSDWELPLTADEFLEKGRFNVYFAGPGRLSLVKGEKDYDQELGRLADDYLEGNRAIISHTLWYIRKKFCGRAKHCNECPVAGYCSYYLKTNTIRLYKEQQDSLFSWIPLQETESDPLFDLKPISQ